MSAIYFHSEMDSAVKEPGYATLRGSERAYMSLLCSDLMLGSIGDLHYAKEWILPMLPSGCYARDGNENSLRLLLGAAPTASLLVDGEDCPVWFVALNTAWVLGGDPLRLLVRLHAQCEIHCWIDGPNRSWVASIIRRGLDTGLYRESQGWPDVARFLEGREDCPVVCSYSVCEQFPNYDCLPEDHPLKQRSDEDRYEEFYDIPIAERWRACMEGLREDDGRLEIKPDDWDGYRFGSGHSVFSLRRKWEKAVAR